MRLPVLLAALATLAGPASAQAPLRRVPFTPGMVVTRSMAILPGTYVVTGGDSAAITVRGDGVVLDLTGVDLVGNADAERPDAFSGVGLTVDGGERVTIRGARIRGFRTAILARGTRGLSLLDNDLSHNWRPRLYSGIEHESLVDWLSYHRNEADEWLRYGAGIYLAGVTGGEVRGNTVRQGMNGLLLTSTTGVKAWNNDFSFNSGLGIGLYRSSRNVVMHNRVDWNVRGYSHGFFNRGQDSAALLMYEQSSHNVVAHNSMTHSGDGLFLWAGQHTMDTGEGGSNDNLFYANDFSFAPTNGIEATFSRNAFVRNRVHGSWHGIWGGYSWQSVILDNDFSGNVEAIAIEHGQDNTIAGNRFDGDTTAIRLWWNRLEPSDWGYPKHRDTRSRNYRIDANRFTGNRVALRVDNTQAVRGSGNGVAGLDSLLVVRGDTAGWEVELRAGEAGPTVGVPESLTVAPLPGGLNALDDPQTRRGRESIIVHDWGPYDGLSPKLWPVGRSDESPLRLRVLGPPGRWRAVRRDGIATLSATTGRTGDTITLTPAAGREGDFAIELEYRGAATVSPFGVHAAAGSPVRFEWERFSPARAWRVRFVALDSAAPVPSDTVAVRQALGTGREVAVLDTARLDLVWSRPPRPTIPRGRVLAEATASVRLATGRYRLRTIADDAIRVWIDGRLALDDWAPGESRVREVTVQLGGTHAIRVEHLQVDGWYELRVDVERERR
jgi:nitrous oxidase accessory protein NosD